MIRPGTLVLVLLVGGNAGTCLGQQILQTPMASTKINVVRGAPFSAEVVVDSSQGLADGNRIVRKTTAVLVRDGQGRSRREQSRLGIQTPPDTKESIVFI